MNAMRNPDWLEANQRWLTLALDALGETLDRRTDGQNDAAPDSPFSNVEAVLEELAASMSEPPGLAGSLRHIRTHRIRAKYAVALRRSGAGRQTGEALRRRTGTRLFYRTHLQPCPGRVSGCGLGCPGAECAVAALAAHRNQARRLANRQSLED